MTKIKYPEMRLNLQAYTNALANAEHQRTMWTNERRTAPWDNLTEIIHYFYDDTKLSSDPQDCVGVILYDAIEVEAVKRVTLAIDKVFSAYGTERLDTFYINVPEWVDVISASERLQCILSKRAV